MEPNIYIWRDENEYGPFSISEVVANLSSGELNGEDFARVGADGEWRILADLLSTTVSDDGASLESDFLPDAELMEETEAGEGPDDVSADEEFSVISEVLEGNGELTAILIRRGDEATGPYSRQEIFAALFRKELTNEDEARFETDVEWRSLSEVLKSGMRLSLLPGEEISRVSCGIDLAALSVPRRPVLPKRSLLDYLNVWIVLAFGVAGMLLTFATVCLIFERRHEAVSTIVAPHPSGSMLGAAGTTHAAPASTSTPAYVKVHSPTPAALLAKREEAIPKTTGSSAFARVDLQATAQPLSLSSQKTTPVASEPNSDTDVAIEIIPGGPQEQTAPTVPQDAGVGTVVAMEPTHAVPTVAPQLAGTQVSNPVPEAPVPMPPRSGGGVPLTNILSVVAPEVPMANVPLTLPPLQMPMLVLSKAAPQVKALVQTVALPRSTEAVPRATLSIVRTVGHPTALLLLCVGPSASAAAVRDPVWQHYAQAHNWLLGAVEFAAPRKGLPPYVRAERGSGEALLHGLKQSGCGDLPLVLYGKGDDGSFVASFVHQNPSAVLAWASFTDRIETTPPQGFHIPPGLLACDNEEATRQPALLKFFTAARAAERRWTWMPVGGRLKTRQAKVDDFVRRYFGSVTSIDPESGIWASIDTMEPISTVEEMEAPQEATWLPNNDLLSAWKGLVPMEPLPPPIIYEDIEKTECPKQPQITFLLRLPSRTSAKHPVNGVLAFCTWEANIGRIRQRLEFRTDQKVVNVRGPEGLVERLIRYAEAHNLAVLTWDTQRIWNLKDSTEDLSKKDQLDFDRDFDKLTATWERGVENLHTRFGMPDREMLLYGESGGAQWAHRLALREPNYFLAIHVHIPSTFDTPTPQANRILWLVTTGEDEGGYPLAKQFYQECRKLNYPIIFKAIPGLGHAGSSIADNLGFRFFDYALKIKEQYEVSQRNAVDPLAELNPKGNGDWLAAFSNPPYVGDYLNQEMYPQTEQELVMPTLRVPLPTKDIAAAWDK